MKIKYLALFVFCIHKCALADIIPKKNMSAGFNSNRFIVRKINDDSSVFYNTVESSGCSNILFKDYVSPLNNKVSREDNASIDKFPINRWLCLLSDTVYINGYDRNMKERIIYSISKSLWVKVNNKKSDIVPSDQDGAYKPLKLYNIKAKNAKGYVVFDKNLTKDDKDTYKGAAELISFCLVQDSTYSALCGSGSLVSDSGQIPYVLKAIESMEIGLNNTVNDKILNNPDNSMSKKNH